MGVGHPKALRRLSPKIVFDDHGGFVSHYPAIVTGIDRDRLRSNQFHDAAIGVLDVHVPVHQKSDVGMLAEIAADDRLHIGRPTVAHRIDDAFDTSCAGANDVHFDATYAAMFGSANREEQRRGRIHIATLHPKRLRN